MTKNKKTRRSLISILKGIDYDDRANLKGIGIESITSDSRNVVPGALFVAISGTSVDGHKYIENAVSKGAVAVLAEKAGREKIRVPLIITPDTHDALGKVSAAFFNHPAKKMKLIGITGTNGKTTTSYLIESIIEEGGGRPGVIGTVSYRYCGLEFPAPLTTPDPVALQELLVDMAEAGVTHVVMEASSHALAQKRLSGLMFDVTLFTNLSLDHLDYHGDMENYFFSKSRLFHELLKPSGAAVVCDFPAHDSESAGSPIRWGKRLVESFALQSGAKLQKGKKQKVIVCGTAKDSVHATKVNIRLDGLQVEVETPEGLFSLETSFTGEFNLKNVLGAVGVGNALGFETELIRRGIAKVKIIPGRLERVAGREDVDFFVDYAHTPDALENVVTTVKELDPKRLVVVFGCGGERDKRKRPLMGKVAGRVADIILVTSDNPRGEDPKGILNDIERGLLEIHKTRMRAEVLLKGDFAGYDIIASRREAIAVAVLHSKPGDVVLVCGKGHENYQITKSGKEFFDDRLEIQKHASVIM